MVHPFPGTRMQRRSSFYDFVLSLPVGRCAAGLRNGRRQPQNETSLMGARETYANNTESGRFRRSHGLPFNIK